MANKLKTEKKMAVISILCEGSSIRAERFVAVLEIPPVVLPISAVRASIMADAKKRRG
jgi:hypothetical protein